MQTQSLAELFAKFHAEQHGSAPATISVQELPGMIVVLSSGVFTNTEKQLADTEEGRKIVQSARRELRSLTRRQIETQVALSARRKVLRSYYDIDVRLGEQVEVYVTEE